MMRRILHTMLRVSDMEKSIEFYTAVLSMRVLRTVEQIELGYTLCFLGYEDEKESAVLELTYNHGVNEYEFGNAYGHIAIGVEDCAKACNEVRSRGGSVIREAAPLANTNEIIAFIEDVNGYKIEFIEFNSTNSTRG